MNESNTVLISGDTYPVKENLRALGGRWDATQRGWRVPADKAEEARSLVSPSPLLNAPAPRDLGTVDPIALASRFGRTAAGASIQSFEGEGRPADEDGTIKLIRGKRFLQVAHTTPRYLSKDFLEDTDNFEAQPGYYYQWDGVEVEASVAEQQADAAEKQRLADEKDRKEISRAAAITEKQNKAAAFGQLTAGLVKSGDRPLGEFQETEEFFDDGTGNTCQKLILADGSVGWVVSWIGDSDGYYYLVPASQAAQAKDDAERKHRVWKWWRPGAYGDHAYPGPGAAESELTPEERAEVALRFANKYAAVATLEQRSIEISVEYCTQLKALLSTAISRTVEIDPTAFQAYCRIYADAPLYSKERDANRLEVKIVVTLAAEHFHRGNLRAKAARLVPSGTVRLNKYVSAVVAVREQTVRG